MLFRAVSWSSSSSFSAYLSFILHKHSRVYLNRRYGDGPWQANSSLDVTLLYCQTVFFHISSFGFFICFFLFFLSHLFLCFLFVCKFIFCLLICLFACRLFWFCLFVCWFVGFSLIYFSSFLNVTIFFFFGFQTFYILTLGPRYLKCP